MAKKKKWDYSISTQTLWTSFDFGRVKAKNYEKALIKAKAKLKRDFEKANHVLGSADVTATFKLEYDETQIVLNEAT